ncbi:MAG: 30S ribosomal protein S6 [Armatimonadota bacterium]|nr:30S ribosomal protein S6 [Armatimonadota bacterium]MDR5696768.1 30S ribosomal protein S6 [Armatimonadota bacterium]
MRKPYEIVFILRPDLDDAQVQAATERVAARIAERGGEVQSIEPWGKRRLAYAIAKHREGYYVFIRFSLEPQNVQDLKQAVSMSEEVIRFLLAEAVPVRVPPAAAAVPAPEPVASAEDAPQPVHSGGGEG